MKTHRVLMIAYACDPDGGGEHWLGWGWAREASRSHEVTLITTSKAKPALQRTAVAYGIDVHCLDVPAWVGWLSRFPSGAGAWLRKCWWQGMALKLARRMHASRAFDIVHQTTFHTFRIPFSCSKLGIPSVWGPIAGGESVPAGFDRCLGQAAAAEKMRVLLNRLNLNMPWVKASLVRSTRILVSNRTTLGFLPSEVHGKCVLMSPNALREEDLTDSAVARANSNVFEILYAGNCVHTRAMPLVFEALAKGMPLDWHLRIVGSGVALEFWKCEVARLGLGSRVEFTGMVSRETLRKYFSETSVLVFPGLRDSGGSALLEAMTLALPILTFAWGGPAEMVDHESAVLVDVRSPDQTVSDIHAGLCHVANQPDVAHRLGQAARVRALANFQWAEKWRLVERIYGEIVH